jgi:hypothetical protein
MYTNAPVIQNIKSLTNGMEDVGDFLALSQVLQNILRLMNDATGPKSLYYYWVTHDLRDES